MGKFINGDWVNDYVPVHKLEEVQSKIDENKDFITLELERFNKRVEDIESKPIEGTK